MKTGAATRESNTRLDSKDSLLLFCPYDRKVTRHARRWVDRAVVCTQCGHSLEVSKNTQGEQFTGVAPNAFAEQRTQAYRAPRPSRQRGALSPVFFAATTGLLMLCGAIVAAITIMGNSSTPASNQGVIAASGQQTAESGVTSEVAGIFVSNMVRVGNTGGTGVYVRRTPNTEDRVRAWPDGTTLRLIGSDVTENGMTWKHVEDPAGNQGWVPIQYTES